MNTLKTSLVCLSLLCGSSVSLADDTRLTMEDFLLMECRDFDEESKPLLAEIGRRMDDQWDVLDNYDRYKAVYRALILRLLRDPTEGGFPKAVYRFRAMKAIPQEIRAHIVLKELQEGDALRDKSDATLAALIGPVRLDTPDHEVGDRNFRDIYNHLRGSPLRQGRLLDHMFRTDPSQGLRACIAAEFALPFGKADLLKALGEPRQRGKRDKVRGLLIADHVVAHFVGTKALELAAVPEQLAAAKQVLRELAARDEFWVRLYVAEIMRQNPELYEEGIEALLVEAGYEPIEREASADPPVEKTPAETPPKSKSPAIDPVPDKPADAGPSVADYLREKYADILAKSDGELHAFGRQIDETIRLESSFLRDAKNAEAFRDLILSLIEDARDGDVVEGMMLEMALKVVSPATLAAIVAPEVEEGGRLHGLLAGDRPASVLRHIEGQGYLQVPTFRHYANYLRENARRPENALTRYMLRKNPALGLRALLSAEFCIPYDYDQPYSSQELSDSLKTLRTAEQQTDARTLILTERTVSDFLLRRQLGSTTAPEQLAAAKQMLRDLAGRKTAWMRIYVAEIMRQFPELRETDIEERLKEADASTGEK